MTMMMNICISIINDAIIATSARWTQSAEWTPCLRRGANKCRGRGRGRCDAMWLVPPIIIPFNGIVTILDVVDAINMFIMLLPFAIIAITISNHHLTLPHQKVQELAEPEIIPMPFVTENSRISLIVPVNEGDLRASLGLVKSFAKNCIEKGDRVFLMLVFLYRCYLVLIIQ